MRSVTRSFRIRTYPNGVQRRWLDRWLGSQRWLWNTALEIRTEAYRECSLTLTGIDLSRWLTQWKHTAGHEWLAQVPATCLTQCLRNLDRAFSNFFAGRASYPKFKRKSASGSLRFQDAGAAWSRGIMSLPKLGVLKLAEALPEVARPDLVTLSRDAAGRYFVSFGAEFEKEPPSLSYQCPAVGVDLGLRHLATLSTGEKIENPKHYERRLRYLRQQQRRLARKQKGSRRRERQKLKVARAHAKIKQEREYALHALTTKLTQEFDLICIEDLNVKGMARGRNARSIHDAAFGEVRRQLTYKSDWRHKILIEVDRWYPSSKTCSNCRHRLDELRLDVREWKCPKCGTIHDRDINAARNLLLEGLRQLAGGDHRDLCVDARDACPDEDFLVQVLAEEARSGQRNRAWMDQAMFC
ncbi:MAG TPA: RNA-guided endonuclease TnpB family protein [Steroidobacteraceae bacterium]|jgi:putative transposase|nr:RNA-guided endonuclease TnpB family protein [Steroidobacteraceae bacterium]